MISCMNMQSRMDSISLQPCTLVYAGENQTLRTIVIVAILVAIACIVVSIICGCFLWRTRRQIKKISFGIQPAYDVFNFFFFNQVGNQ